MSSPATGEVDDRARAGLPILRAEAKRMFFRLGKTVPLDELEALGRDGLLRAATTYDASRGKFPTYVTRRVKWAILDGLRRDTHARAVRARACGLAGADQALEAHEAAEPVTHEPITQEAGQRSLEQLLRFEAAAAVIGLLVGGFDVDLVPHGAEGPEEQAIRRQSREFLADAIRRLHESERVVLERYYSDGQSFETIGQEMGISKTTAFRHHTDAITALRKAFGAGRSSAK